MIEIKLLGPLDAGILSNIAPDVFDDPIVQSSTQEFINDSRHRLIVALDGGIVVGFVSAVVYLHPDKATPELWINEVGVAPTYQGQGIGKMLLRRTLEEAQKAGCKEAWVLTERGNDAAMALYKSIGGIEEVPDPTMFTFRL
jgi:ribosomal protein S18 acetylase RimI-like enzyme